MMPLRAVAKRLPPATRVSLIASGLIFCAIALFLHLEAHRTGGPRDRLGRGLDVVGVEIFELQLRDLPDLRHRHLTRDGAARLLAARSDLRRLAKEERRGRRAHLESE